MVRFFHMAILFTGVHTDMVFLRLDPGRNKPVAFFHHVGKLLPSVFAEFPDQFLLRHVVENHMRGKTGQIVILFTRGFFAFLLWPLQIFWLRRIRIADRFRLIEEDDFPVAFPQKRFDAIATPSAEKEKRIPVIRIQLKLKTDDSCQALNSTAKVRIAGRQVDLVNPFPSLSMSQSPHKSVQQLWWCLREN